MNCTPGAGFSYAGMSGFCRACQEEIHLQIWEELLLVLGLSMDGFAASVCMGIALGPESRGRYRIVALVSGCHAAMVVLGCWLGMGLQGWIGTAWPWVAAALLLALGANMLRTAGREENCKAGLTPGAMAALSLATSLDAFTVGVAFSLMEVPMLRAGGLTLLVMGALSILGAWFGGSVGKRHRKTARLAGGLILCILGFRLFWSALGTLTL